MSKPDPRLEVLRRLAVCPDDGGSLVACDAGLRCGTCAREYHLSEDGVVEMLPRQPLAAGRSESGRGESGRDEYWSHYLTTFSQPLSGSDARRPWGAPEDASAITLARKRIHIDAVRRCLSNPSQAVTPTTILCDLTGGAGHYTLAYASLFDFVIHCDLDPASLLYSAKRAKSLGIANILFVRIDYLQAPFVHSLDRIICLDSLIRGPEHELRALTAIRRMLSPSGLAVVDFHNWWHNPLRRLGLLKGNFPRNGSYSLKQVTRLLSSAGFTHWDYTPFRQEAADSGMRRAIAALLPPTRLILKIEAR